MEFSEAYTPYEFTKKGLFSIHVNEYIAGEGWASKQEERTIIGETDDCFIEKLIPSGHGEWIGEKVIEHKYILPIGLHKSRLIRWTYGQLSLFENENNFLKLTA